MDKFYEKYYNLFQQLNISQLKEIEMAKQKRE